MITVHVSTLAPEERWQANLLELSFLDVGQPGELVRLAAVRPGETPLPGATGRVVAVPCWDPHPWTGDRYAGYRRPAAVFHWLARELLADRPVSGPILLLDTPSLLRAPVTPSGLPTVRPGRAVATPWDRFPAGNGPFGLCEAYRSLASFCRGTHHRLPPLTLPACIDARDLLALAPRWLEVTALLRLECSLPSGPPLDAERIAFLLAALEHGIDLKAVNLTSETDQDHADAPILVYRRPIESPRGEIVWDPAVHRAGLPILAERARPGAAREILERIARLTDGGPAEGTDRTG